MDGLLVHTELEYDFKICIVRQRLVFSIVIFEALKLQRAPGAGNLFLKPDYNPGQWEIASV